MCGHGIVDYKTLYDDRYGYPGTYTIVKCRNCGHKCLDASFSPSQITQLYSDYYPRSSQKIEAFKPHREVSGLDSWLRGDRFNAYRWVPENVRVLDIGCGFGETLGYHMSRGCDAYGVDADSNIRQIAEKFGYNMRVGLFNPDDYDSDFFDYVTLDQVVEHLSDPIEILSNVQRVMKPGATLILSTPNSNGWGSKIFGDKWINWHVPYHLQYFSKKSMEITAKKAGLILEKTRTVTNSDWLYFQWVHLLTYPETGVPSVFWSPKAICGHEKKVVIERIGKIHKTRINHVITRIFDLFEVGDNYLFYLRKPKV